MLRILPLLLLLSLSACGSDPGPSDPSEDEPRTLLEMLDFTGSSEVAQLLVADETPAAHFEDRVTVVLAVRSTADSLLTTDIDLCSFRIAVLPVGAGSEPVAIGGDVVNRDCDGLPRLLTLAPGQQVSVRMQLWSGTFLDVGDPSLEYRLQAVLTAEGQAVAVDRGSVTIRPPGRNASSGLDSLSVWGTIMGRERTIQGVTLRSVVLEAIVVNQGSWPVLMDYGACPIVATAHADSAVTSPPAFYSERRVEWGTGVSFGCSDVLLMSFLRPGDTLVSLRDEYEVQDILGDSLSPGTYRFRGTVELGDTLFSVDFGDVEVPQTWLPYPEAANLDGFDYTVATSVLEEMPTVLRTTLNVRGAVSLTLTRFLLAECPFVVMAYADSLDRGRVPPVEPVWRSHPPDCSGRIPVTLTEGEERSFALDFGADDVLASGAPEQRYYFGVLVNIHADREDAERQTLRLSGGDAFLRR